MNYADFYNLASNYELPNNETLSYLTIVNQSALFFIYDQEFLLLEPVFANCMIKDFYNITLLNTGKYNKSVKANNINYIY